jgi:AraC-like DNA-binding protein
MDIEINEEGAGRVEIFHTVPDDLREMLLPNAIPLAILSGNFKGLLQQFKGKGFAAWYSRYWTKRPVVIRTRAGIPVLELRIAMLNSIKGYWEKIAQPDLPLHFFNMSFTPHVITRAIFESINEYQTFDIHFELSFLESLGFEYHILDAFIKKVFRKEPAEINASPFPCPGAMVDAVHTILQNNHSDRGRTYLLECKVREILLLALEALSKNEETLPMALKHGDIKKLEDAKAIIENSLPVYPGNEFICRNTGLNEFKLSVGFRHLLNTTPYDYYMECKMRKGQELLRVKTNNVEDTAFLLGYEDASAFIKEFKKMFSYTPGWFKKYGKF